MNTETRSSRYRGIDTWKTGEVLAALHESQLAAAAAVGPALPALGAAAEAAAARLAGGSGRLVYAGAGASGRLAVQDGCELWPTFGFPLERTVFLLAGGEAALLRAVENAEDDAAAGAARITALDPGPGDVLVAVAASGRTPFTVAAARAARSAGMLTIAIAGNAGTPLLAAADHPVLLATGAEPIAGSTRLKAGTAQKIALNLFSTLLMIRLGHVHDGLMVDVRPTNAKLVARSVAMVATISGAGEAEAREALSAAGGDVKRAVLLLRGLAPEEAEERLAASGGVLREALAGL